MGGYSLLFFELILTFFGILMMLRLILQKGGLAFGHPLSQFLYKTTQWLIKPLRKIVKPYKGWDISIVVGVFLVFLAMELIELGFAIHKANFIISYTTVFIVKFCMVVLETFKVYIYAFWLGLLAYYFHRYDKRDVQLFRALNFVFDVILRNFGLFGLLKGSKLALFIFCSIWLFLLDPYIHSVFQKMLII